MAAKKSTATKAVIPAHVARHQFNPEAVGAVTRYMAQCRRRDAAFDERQRAEKGPSTGPLPAIVVRRSTRRCAA